jgi:hypothetical protein
VEETAESDTRVLAVNTPRVAHWCTHFGPVGSSFVHSFTATPQALHDSKINRHIYPCTPAPEIYPGYQTAQAYKEAPAALTQTRGSPTIGMPKQPTWGRSCTGRCCNQRQHPRTNMPQAAANKARLLQSVIHSRCYKHNSTLRLPISGATAAAAAMLPS